MKRLALTLALPAWLIITPAAPAQQPVTAEPAPAASQENADREQRLAQYLNGIQLIGKFTIDGKDAAPKTETYTISKCEKLDQPDMYRLTARIQYGEVDAEVPLDLKILWSGNTPVITMDAFWIPGMGTFDARVMIHQGRYAGTWQHDAVGGHMFGVLKKIESEAKPDDQSETNARPEVKAVPQR